MHLCSLPSAVALSGLHTNAGAVCSDLHSMGAICRTLNWLYRVSQSLISSTKDGDRNQSSDYLYF